MDIPHELRDEFPQEISLIERMIRTNYVFSEVVVPLFIPPEIRNTVRGIPFQCTQTDLWRPSGRRKRSGGRYYPRPDRNSLDAGEPPAGA
jgi:hypothetical protein